MEELLQSWAWLLPIALPPIVTFMVQLAKRKGVNPMFALAAFSVLVSGLYFVVMNYVPQQMMDEAVLLLLAVAGGANLLYNVLKGYFPSLTSSGQ